MKISKNGYLKYNKTSMKELTKQEYDILCSELEKVTHDKIT